MRRLCTYGTMEAMGNLIKLILYGCRPLAKNKRDNGILGTAVSHRCAIVMKISLLAVRWNAFNFFSRESAKAEHGLSSLSCVWMYVDQNTGNPPPPEMAYPLGIP